MRLLRWRRRLEGREHRVVVGGPMVAGLLAIALSIGGCSSGERTPPPATGDSAPVIKVTDGDTIHVRYEGHDERVRLIGVNAPEVPWYGGRGQCFGVEAGLYARRRLSGRVVRLSFDSALRDRYGRLLAYVYLGHELFNLTLVQLGYAVADPVPPDTAMASNFASAEAEARRRKQGLWSACPARAPL